MNKTGNVGFAERRKAALEAKTQLLRKLENVPKPGDPAMQAKLAERQALAEAREARRIERERTKREEAERKAAELAAAQEAALRAEEEARIAREAEAVALEAARKAERDRRYAARKARQR